MRTVLFFSLLFNFFTANAQIAFEKFITPNTDMLAGDWEGNGLIWYGNRSESKAPRAYNNGASRLHIEKNKNGQLDAVMSVMVREEGKDHFWYFSYKFQFANLGEQFLMANEQSVIPLIINTTVGDPIEMFKHGRFSTYTIPSSAPEYQLSQGGIALNAGLGDEHTNGWSGLFHLVKVTRSDAQYYRAIKCATEAAKKIRKEKEFKEEDRSPLIRECVAEKFQSVKTTFTPLAEGTIHIKKEGVLPALVNINKEHEITNWDSARLTGCSYALMNDLKDFFLLKGTFEIYLKNGKKVNYMFPQDFSKKDSIAGTYGFKEEFFTRNYSPYYKTHTVEQPANSKEDNEGTALLFKGVKTTLTAEEKDNIFKETGFSLSKDKKKFVWDKEDKNKEYPFAATISIVDLNDDGTDEVVVNWGNTFTSGVAGSSVTLFIKLSNGYQQNLGFGGNIAEVIPSVHNGFPDLSISAPGMKIPIWRFDGREYKYFNSVDDNEYKQLKPVTFDNFQRNPKLVLTAKNNGNGGSTATSSDASNISKKPNPNAKKLILKRWKAQDIIGALHENFQKIKSRNESPELEFAADGILYIYVKGLLKQSYQYVVPPDGNSLLLKGSNGKEGATIEIILLNSKELRIKFNEMAQQDTIVLNPVN